MKNYLIMLCIISSAYAAEPTCPSSLMELYCKSNRNRERFFLTYLEEYLKKSDITYDHTSVLSIGCGTGWLERSFATSKPLQSIHGIDTRENMINFCQEKHKEINKLSFQQCCPEDFSSRNVYDLALVPTCFNELEDKQKALNAICGSLKRGGHLFATIETSKNAEPFALKAYHDLLKSIPLVGSLLTHLPNPTGGDRVSYGELHVMLSQAGFELKKTEYKSHDWKMPALEWRKTQLPLLLSTAGAQYLINTISDNWYAQKTSGTAFWYINKNISPEEKAQHDAPFFPEIKDELIEKIRNNDFLRYLFNKFLDLCLNHMRKNDDNTYTWTYETTVILAQKK